MLTMMTDTACIQNYAVHMPLQIPYEFWLNLKFIHKNDKEFVFIKAVHQQFTPRHNEPEPAYYKTVVKSVPT